jgi:hypothetical protein
MISVVRTELAQPLVGAVRRPEKFFEREGSTRCKRLGQILVWWRTLMLHRGGVDCVFVIGLISEKEDMFSAVKKQDSICSPRSLLCIDHRLLFQVGG